MHDGPEPSDILGLLAGEDRLRVAAAIVLGAGDTAEIGAATGLTSRAVAKAVARLVAGGLVQGEEGKGYRLRTEVLAGAARQAAAGDRSEPDDFGASDPRDAAVLRRFLVGGRLVSIPSGHAKRRVVLDHLAGLFEPGRYYPEAQVNEILGAYNDDYATLRRHLVDEGFLERADQVYWRTGGTIDVEGPPEAGAPA
jgi:hypothetical protein